MDLLASAGEVRADVAGCEKLPLLPLLLHDLLEVEGAAEGCPWLQVGVQGGEEGQVAAGAQVGDCGPLWMPELRWVTDIAANPLRLAGAVHFPRSRHHCRCYERLPSFAVAFPAPARSDI